MHLAIYNCLEGNVDFSVDHAGGGMDWSVPTGESKRVANVPPEKIEIDCYRRFWRKDKHFAMEVGTIEVLAGDSGYKSTKLDCPREKSKKIKPYTKVEMEEQRGDPVEIFRRSNSDLCGKATSAKLQATPGAGTKEPCAWYATARWSPRPTTSGSLPAGWRRPKKTASASEHLRRGWPQGYTPRMEDGSWRTLGREYVYQNPWCAFRVDEVELPGGVRIEYGVLESGGFAAVVPITAGGDVVLVRQWRQPLGAFTLELPSGGVDVDEKPEEAARRELFEETGYLAEGLEHLASVHTSTGRSTEVCHLFRCTAVRDERGPRPDPTEFIRVVELPFGEALEEVRGGAITDAAAVLGLLWSACDGAASDGRLHWDL